jgi:ABC-type glycerol-3-phosphate transport system permease component
MPQGMEPDTKKYLLKVLNSLFVGLLWLSLNVLGGLYLGYGIIDKKLSLYNIFFFVWFLLSLLALLYYYYRTWKNG